MQIMQCWRVVEEGTRVDQVLFQYMVIVTQNKHVAKFVADNKLENI